MAVFAGSLRSLFTADRRRGAFAPVPPLRSAGPMPGGKAPYEASAASTTLSRFERSPISML